MTFEVLEPMLEIASDALRVSRDRTLPPPVSPVDSRWVLAARVDRDLSFQDLKVISGAALPRQRTVCPLCTSSPLHPYRANGASTRGFDVL